MAKHKMHPLRIEEMRQKIQATLLIKRLENHIFVDPSDAQVEKKVMTDSQVRAALGLLGKILPNVSEQKTDLNVTGNPLPAVINVIAKS